MQRTIFAADHDDFRASFRTFLSREVQPHYADWEHAGLIPRDLYRSAGAMGFLGMAIPEPYGGVGVDDFRFNVVLNEECQYAGAASLGMGITLQNDLCLPYLLELGTAEQKRRWLPGMASGELPTALAMTEPATGSDLAAIATTARLDGDHFRVNGAKTFISGGVHADLVITAVTTDPQAGRAGISLLAIERDTPGFTTGRKLEKVGLHAQDTAELFFDDVRVPVANLLGDVGTGFAALRHNLAQERLSIAVAAVAAARAALTWTLEYVTGRSAFGQPIGTFQHSRFVLAEAKTEIDLGETFIDRCIEALNRKALSPEDAAQAKWWSTDMQGRVVDRCVQLHGGYGYMREYPIARAYADARVTRIFGGSNEIMKEIIGRSMGLR